MIDWGGTTEKGFLPVANIFLLNYLKLGLTMEEAMLTIQILQYGRSKRLPYPKVSLLASLTGKTQNTLRKYIASLREKGMLITKSRVGRSNYYDFTPLFDKLVAIQESEEKIEEVDDSLEEIEQNISIPYELKVKNQVPTVTPVEEALPENDETRLHENEEGRLPKFGGAHRRIQKEQNKLKNTSLDSILEAALSFTSRCEKNNPKKGSKRLQAFLNKSPEKYTSLDIEIVFAQHWGAKWKSPPSRFTMKELSLVKKLNEGYGPEVVAKVVEAMIVRWESLRREFSLNGYPSIPLLWGYRNSFFPFLLEEDEESKPQWGSHFSDDQSRPEGQEVGW